MGKESETPGNQRKLEITTQPLPRVITQQSYLKKGLNVMFLVGMV